MTLELVPAFYRERDARPDGLPGFLESLLTVIGDQLGLVEVDLERLYDDLFIETCDASLVPYIGDLVGVTPGAPVESDAVLTRAAVANAIALRRRKGTVAVIEELAFDLTGWPAVAVELFQRVAVTQSLQHVVPARGTTLSLRSALALERLDGSFDTAAHTLEVRRIGSGRGRYNVQNVAVMVWRDALLTHDWVDAHALDAQRFRFNPLGVDQPLATRPQSEVTLTHHATPRNVPGPLTRRAMAAALDDCYGLGLSVAVRPGGAALPVDVADVVVCDLSDSAAGWSNVARLKPAQLAVDPELGRLAFGTAQAAPPQVNVVTTAPADVGGSESSARLSTPPGQPVTPVRVDGAGGVATTVIAALAAAGGQGTIELRDSRTYSGALTASVPAQAQLRVVSAPGAMPVLDVANGMDVTVGDHGVLTLNGLVIAGGPVIVRGRPDRIELADCTLVPGQRLDADAQVTPPVEPSLILALDADWQTEVTLDNCISGPLEVPGDGTTLTLADSIVDGVDDGLGRTHAAGAPARVVPALRAPSALGALTLPVGSTTLRLMLGTDPARVVDLGIVPTTAAQAAALLDTVLAGSGARALAAGDRVVLLGDGRQLAVAPEAGSGLAAGLGLTGTAARTRVVLGGRADVAGAAGGGNVTLTAPAERYTVALAGGAADLAALAAALESAIAGTDPALAGVIVGALGQSLVVVPADAAAVTFAAAAGDLDTIAHLGLASPRPAIAGDRSGAPGATLRLARCTVLGSVAVEAIDLVTDSIVTGLITSERRQIGCVQYSWIAPGSRTPRRHATVSAPEPAFVSRHYATPGYGRLRRAGATALVRGAADGFELGALARLRQTQRDDNLRRGIEEFLRFGLEAGVTDGT